MKRLLLVLFVVVSILFTSVTVEAQLPTARGVRIGALSFLQQWSRTMQTTLRSAQIGLFNSTRTLALFHTTAWDIINSYNENPTYDFYDQTLRDVPAPAGADINAAILGAGYTIYVDVVPSEIEKYNQIRAFQLDWLRRTEASPRSIATGYQYGVDRANTVLTSRRNDGYNVLPIYNFLGTPGTFRCSCTPVGNGWGAVTPWVIPNAQSFVPPGPAFLTNPEEYVLDYNEVFARGIFNSTRLRGAPGRTPIETFVGVFWSIDTFGTILPPATYFEMMQNIALQEGYDLRDEARFLAVGALTLADTHIVAWRTKYTFNNWRPATGIVFAGTDNYAATVPDASWIPLGPTPPFPDYISGHSTFGGAVGRFLQQWFARDDYRWVIFSDALPKLTVRYLTFSSFIADNAASRVYLGVHWRQSTIDGVNTGISVANNVFANTIRPL